MTLLRESYLYQLCCTLLSLYEKSACHRLLCRAGRWCNAQIDESRVLRPLAREGVVAKAWGESLLCRLLSFLLNLPGILLHKLYSALQQTFEGSFFARLAFSMGDSTAIAQSWFILLLWIIPYDYWNNAYTMVAFVLLLLLFYVGSMHRADYRLDAKAIGFYPFLMLGAVFLGTVFSYAPGESSRFFLYHLSAALCVLVTVSAVRCSRDLVRLVTGSSICVLVSAGYGIVQRIQGVEVNTSYVDVRLNPDMPGRVMSFFDNPNTFAEVLILLLPLVLALVLSAKKLWSKAFFALIFLMGAAALAMTYSRASWVGMACAMAVLVFLWKPRLIPAFLLLCLAAIPLLPDSIWNRILTIGNPADTSTASRIPLVQAALAVIKRSPITGAGLGTSAVQAFIRDLSLYHGRAPYVHAHNFYIEVWVEAGILGLVGFLGSMLWNIKRCAHTVRRVCTQHSAARTITCAAAAALCGAMVCGLADYLWNYPRVLCIFWFVFAIALAGCKLCLQGDLEKEDYA